MFDAVRRKIKNFQRQIKSDDEYRLGRRGTFLGRFAIGTWNWTVCLCKFEEGWSLHFFCLWISLCKSTTDPIEIMDCYGVTYNHRECYLSLNWREKYKFFYMPWMYDHCRTELMLDDTSFVKYEMFEVIRGKPQRIPEPENQYRQQFPYRYVTKCGETQERIATVTVERRSWCWRSWPFSSFRWPSKTHTDIHIEFNEEVGEDVGSYKGGVVGCGAGLRSGETPEDALRRVEKSHNKYNKFHND